MIYELAAVAVVAVGYAAYKHISLATIEADVKAAVAKAEASVTSTADKVVADLKADLSKYL